VSFSDDRPPLIPPWTVPPWERPDGFRLDCEPHRGPFLRTLANIALVSFLASLLLVCISPCVFLANGSQPAIFLPLFLELPGGGLGLLVWWLALGDCARMRAGRMDPAGEFETQFACGRGLFTFLLCATVLLISTFVMICSL
jgi:hypothetical protein